MKQILLERGVVPRLGPETLMETGPQAVPLEDFSLAWSELTTKPQ